jgi:hypothetical protein
MTTKETQIPAAQSWATPTLTFQGTVGQVLKQGGGKLSLQLADGGEMRCEKPHVAKCTKI